MKRIFVNSNAYVSTITVTNTIIGGSRRAAKSRKVLMMMKAAKRVSRSRSWVGVGLEQTREGGGKR